MSQRRPKLPSQPGKPPPEYTVKFVCTDRGQHARVVLRHLKDTRGETGAGNHVMWLDGPKSKAPLTSWHPEAGDQGFTFHCGRCGRNPELRQETMFKLLDGLAALPADPDNAHPIVDISLLPF